MYTIYIYICIYYIYILYIYILYIYYIYILYIYTIYILYIYILYIYTIYIHMYIILYYILRRILISFEFSPRRFRSISPPTAWLTWTTVRPLDQTPTGAPTGSGFFSRFLTTVEACDFATAPYSPGSSEVFWVDTQSFI